MIDTMKGLIHRAAPRALVNLLWSAAGDVKELRARLRDPRPRPWRIIHNTGGGDFYGGGALLFETVRKAGALSPSAHVLDIGCGAGRLAVPLCAYLDEAGAYTGFDIARPGLRFARRVARGRCAIRFVHAELANAEYNRRGADPADYRFPAEAATIDLAVATSLFTHILPDVAQAYLREAGRVLKPQGRLMLTAFHVDAEARDALRSGRARQRLTPWGEAAWAADPRHPERAIGFDAEAFLTWAEAAGLRLAQPVIPGDWREPDRGADFQDWLVFEKA